MEGAMPRLLVVNGPNLNLLGQRETDVYGDGSLEDITERLEQLASEAGIECDFFQSNGEGELIDYLHRECYNADGLILNGGALTHYSYALRDAIASVRIDTVEVHISNIYAREEFRHKSVMSPVCIGLINGLGVYGYELALSYFVNLWSKKNDD
jgi:3-dehydroquinate dehydratase-2